jgi:hypothetical protein
MEGRVGPQASGANLAVRGRVLAWLHSLIPNPERKGEVAFLWGVPSGCLPSSRSDGVNLPVIIVQPLQEGLGWVLTPQLDLGQL